MFLASENIDFTGLSHVFLLGGGEIGSFFSLRAMGALTGASPERARIVVSEWQAYG